jgi:hypothetical protein
MRHHAAGLAMLVLGACADGTATPPAHAAEVAACAAAVAGHVGKGVDAVSASWAGTTAGGVGVVSVTDVEGSGSDRLHTCEVDGSGRVLAIRHPGA